MILTFRSFSRHDISSCISYLPSPSSSCVPMMHASSRLSRVLFREDTDSSSDQNIPAIQIEHEFDAINCHKTSDVGDPSSPFKLNYSQDMCSSPTYLHTGVKELTLVSSPTTPKTIIRRSRNPMTIKQPPSAEVIASRSARGTKRSLLTPRLANVNPFTPNSAAIASQNKRYKVWNRNSSAISFTLTHSSDSSGLMLDGDHESISVSENEHPAQMFEEKWSSESDPIIADHLSTGEGDWSPASRYTQDFMEVEKLGSGHFGSVFKCINRLDGCIYALKKRPRPIKGTSFEKRALTEVYAHAVLGKHRRVVHYFSAWAEEDSMFIQNEYCEGGSLADLLVKLREKNFSMPFYHVRRILLHVAQGLKYIHNQNLAHLDIKPDNIFLTKKFDIELELAKHDDSISEQQSSATNDDNDDGFQDDSDSECSNEVCYKIGDLGLVTHAGNRKEVEEGDCRYLAPELLNVDIEKDLTKSDIFSLGMCIVEILLGKPLPKNGNEWHELRSDDLPPFPGVPKELNDLIKRMISREPSRRPSAYAILREKVIYPSFQLTRAELKEQLNSSMAKIEELNRQLLNLTGQSDNSHLLSP